jgi:hypothetical protein
MLTYIKYNYDKEEPEIINKDELVEDDNYIICDKNESYEIVVNHIITNGDPISIELMNYKDFINKCENYAAEENEQNKNAFEKDFGTLSGFNNLNFKYITKQNKIIFTTNDVSEMWSKEYFILHHD